MSHVAARTLGPLALAKQTVFFVWKEWNDASGTPSFVASADLGLLNQNRKFQCDLPQATQVRVTWLIAPTLARMGYAVAPT
jgi:hypothetical protein